MEKAVADGQTSRYGEFARFYDRVIGNAAVPIVTRSFEQSRRRYGIEFKSAADVGCGTGTFLLHLARFCDVLYGVDGSARMLSIARQKLGRLSVGLLQQDLRELQLPKPVDLLTCTFDTLNYLTTTRALHSCLRRIHDNLDARGHFTFDVITGAGMQASPRRLRQVVRLPDALATWHLDSDVRTGLSRVEMRWQSRTSSGTKKYWREVHWQRWYSIPYLSALLRRSGFRVLGVHDMASFEPASSGTWWAHFVLTHPRSKHSGASGGQALNRGGA